MFLLATINICSSMEIHYKVRKICQQTARFWDRMENGTEHSILILQVRIRMSFVSIVVINAVHLLYTVLKHFGGTMLCSMKYLFAAFMITMVMALVTSKG